MGANIEIQWVMDFHRPFLVRWAWTMVGLALHAADQMCGSYAPTGNLVVPTIINPVVWMKLGNLPILPHMSSVLETSWQSQMLGTEYAMSSPAVFELGFGSCCGLLWVAIKDGMRINFILGLCGYDRRGRGCLDVWVAWFAGLLGSMGSLGFLGSLGRWVAGSLPGMFCWIIRLLGNAVQALTAPLGLIIPLPLGIILLCTSPAYYSPHPSPSPSPYHPFLPILISSSSIID